MPFWIWAKTEEEKHRKARYTDGPHGVGNPDDKSLRRVEIEVMIPKKMRDKARDEKCNEEVKQFTECCKDHSVLMVVACRRENAALKNCLSRWYEDEGFKEQCKNEYLEERSEFRRTGIRKKDQHRWPTNV